MTEKQPIPASDCAESKNSLIERFWGPEELPEVLVDPGGDADLFVIT